MDRPLIGFICEERFQRVGGTLYTPNQFVDALWARYAETLGRFAVIARVEERAEPERGATPVDLGRFDLRPLPSFQGPLQLLPQLPRLHRALRQAMRGIDGFILRCPGTISPLSLPLLLAGGKPFAIEMVGDPAAVFLSGVGGLASGLIGRAHAVTRRRMFASASAIIYVTDSYLQQVYPPPAGVHAAGCSDVILAVSDLAAHGRAADEFQTQPIRLLFGGSMEQSYKGLSTLLEAVALLRDKGRSVSLQIAGRGRCEGNVRAMIAGLGLGGSVTLTGYLGNAELIEQIGRSDLLVLPSRTEGLPRVIIEAMARGLPVIASAVGGIPELLAERDMAPVDDAPALAGRIRACIDDPVRLATMSAENLSRARRFAGPTIERERASFYEHFRTTVEAAAAAG